MKVCKVAALPLHSFLFSVLYLEAVGHVICGRCALFALNLATLFYPSVCIHGYVIINEVAHTCTSIMHGIFFIQSTPCHLLISFCSFPPLYLAVQLEMQAWKSKVQVCRLADESQRGSFPPTVCKYVVTLIERSSTSQPLSFLVCMCVIMVTAGPAGDTWH